VSGSPWRWYVGKSICNAGSARRKKEKAIKNIKTDTIITVFWDIFMSMDFMKICARKYFNSTGWSFHMAGKDGIHRRQRIEIQGISESSSE
jgi:hypothetical protein